MISLSLSVNRLFPLLCESLLFVVCSAGSEGELEPVPQHISSWKQQQVRVWPVTMVIIKIFTEESILNSFSVVFLGFVRCQVYGLGTSLAVH